MKTVFVRILSDNLGDGWDNNDRAAIAYARWLEKTHRVETEVLQNTSGIGGGSFDDNGCETPDGGTWWQEWCESDEAKKYFMNEA